MLRFIAGLSVAVAVALCGAAPAQADPCDSYSSDFNPALCAVKLATAPNAEDNLVIRPALLMVGALERPTELVAPTVDAAAQELAGQLEQECAAALVVAAAGNVRIATRIIESGGTIKVAKNLAKAGDAEGAMETLLAGTATTFELAAIADGCS
jgi:hypothetical protein